MKFIDLKDKSIQELEALVKEKRLALFTLRNKLKTMQLKGTHELRDTKRDIARILTSLNEKRKADGA